MIPKKRFILIIVTLIIISALLHRGYPMVGLVSTMLLLGVYILMDARKTVKYMSGFKQISNIKRIKSITAVALVLVLVTGVVSGRVPYFFMLVLLATDYMIYDNQTIK